MALQPKAKFSQYEDTVLNFINNQGVFYTYTTDNNFQHLLHRLLNKQLAVQKNCITYFFQQQDIHNSLQKTLKSKQEVILFAERVFSGHSTQEFISAIKAAYKNVRLIVLTNEVEKAALVRLYELGVDNFITKPLSMNTLVEKIAFTLRPQSKIGELLDKAKSQMERGFLEQALSTCNEVLNMKPNSAAACMVRGDIYSKMGEREKAIAEYKTAHQNSMLYLEPLKRLAGHYQQNQENQKQLQYLLKIDKLSPLNVDRKVEIGALHVEQGNRESGQEYLNEAIKLASKEARDNLGNLALQIADRIMQLDNQVAEQYYRKALQVKGDKLGLQDVETFNRLGICLRQQKKPQLAIKEYLRALEISSENERLLYNLSMAYMEAGQIKQARDMISKLLKINPEFHLENEVVSYNIGMLYYRISQLEHAKGFFQKALEINPEYAPAKQLLHKLQE
ncbi:MAG: tetratricopeptide repeat protein [Desulfohalobiaceae bacterium]